MLRRNSRPLFLLLLIALCAVFMVVAPVAAAPGPDLTVSISHVGNIGAGNNDFLGSSTTGTVAVVVTNIGDTDTSGVITVTVTLDGGLTFGILDGSSSLIFSCAGGATVTCNSNGIDNIAAAGGKETISFFVNAPAAAGTGFVNSVTVAGGGEPGGNTGNNSGSDPAAFAVVAAAPDMQITSLTHIGTQGNDFVVGSTTGSFNVAIANVGTAPTSGQIDVTISLGGGLTLLTQSPSAFACSGASTVICSSSSVIGAGAGAAIIFTVTASSTTGGPFSNSAVVGRG